MPLLGWWLLADALASIQIRLLSDSSASSLAQETTQQLFAALRQNLPGEQYQAILAYSGQAVLAWQQSRSAANQNGPGKFPIRRLLRSTLKSHLFLDDDPASLTATGIAGWLRLVVVQRGVNDDATSDDVARPFTKRRSLDVGHLAGDALFVGDQLHHVAGVMLTTLGVTVGLVRGVEMAAGTGAVRRTAIALFMDMEAMEARRQAADLGKYL